MNATAPIFGSPQVLPRGPHQLDEAEIAASQRLRIMSAITAVVAEEGYAPTTIAAITRRAGVSRTTFYGHYRDKEACFLAAYDHFVDVLFARMSVDIGPHAAWHAFIDVTLAGYLGTLDGDPDAARAFVLEGDAGGPAVRARRRTAYGRLARLLHGRHDAMRREDPSLGALPEEVYLGMVYAVRELVRDSLDAQPENRLTGLAPTIRFWLTATLLGAAAAGRP